MRKWYYSGAQKTVSFQIRHKQYVLKYPIVVEGYEKAGVCGISVLTDGPYFGGALEDLLLARAVCRYTPFEKGIYSRFLTKL